MERHDLEDGAVAKDTVLDARNAGHAVQKALILHAWRQSRRRSEQLTLKSEQLSIKMKNLQLQVTVLRQLLHGEMKRMFNACELIRVLTEHSEVNSKLRFQAEREKEARLEEWNYMDKEVNDLREQCINYQNTLLFIKEDCVELENRLRKERDKIAKFRQQNKHLVTKVDEYEATLLSKSNRISELEQMIQEIELQTSQLLAAEVLATSSMRTLAQQHHEMASKAETELDERHQLILKVETLEREVNDLVAQNKSLGGTVHVKDQQIADLSQRLDEQSSTVQETWWQRVLYVASSFVRIPYQVITFLHARGIATIFATNSSP